MNNDRNTNCTDGAIKNNKKSMQKHLIYSLICIAIALISFFAISNWATSADTYSRIINTLNELQKKALELTGTATALATGAAAIPGDATTPIANKLADVAGYMVIVYAVIIIEKYLLTITGYIAFKILFPIGCILMERGYKVPTSKEKKAFLIEKNMPKEGMLKVLDLAKKERAAGRQVMIMNMKKNKKFQKEQLAEQGYTDITECYRDSVDNI